jgi:hypothetical protein
VNKLIILNDPVVEFCVQDNLKAEQLEKLASEMGNSSSDG